MGDKVSVPMLSFDNKLANYRKTLYPVNKVGLFFIVHLLQNSSNLVAEHSADQKEVEWEVWRHGWANVSRTRRVSSSIVAQ